MKNTDMKPLIRLEDFLSTLKHQLEADMPMGIDFAWNLVCQSQNIVLKLIDDLYDHSNTESEVV